LLSIIATNHPHHQDPIELSAIASTFGASASREQPVYIGSIKPSVGHTEGCAGIAGIFRAILSLENGLILPTVGIETVNPKLRFADWNLSLPQDVTPWPTKGLRRVSVNSFGFGGANAHVILDDAYHYLKEHGIQAAHSTLVTPALQPNEQNGVHTGVDGHDSTSSCQKGTINGTNGSSNGNTINGNHANFGSHGIQNGTTGTNGADHTTGIKRLLVYSARDENSLQKTIEIHKAYAAATEAEQQSKRSTTSISNIAYTLAQRRSIFDHRCFAVAESLAELKDQLQHGPLKHKRAYKPNGVIFVLTGQGAQWAGMGSELMSEFPVFAASMARSAACLESLGCSFDLLEEVSRPSNDSNIDSPEYSQPICTAVQVGLIDLLRGWSVIPKAVVGHSSGEIGMSLFEYVY
jgi:acyl transferase domain-containing protein